MAGAAGAERGGGGESPAEKRDREGDRAVLVVSYVHVCTMYDAYMGLAQPK